MALVAVHHDRCAKTSLDIMGRVAREYVETAMMTHFLGNRSDEMELSLEMKKAINRAPGADEDNACCYTYEGTGLS